MDQYSNPSFYVEQKINNFALDRPFEVIFLARNSETYLMICVLF